MLANYKVMNFSFDSLLYTGIGFLFIFIFEHIFIKPYTLDEFLFMNSAAIFLCTGLLFQNVALQIGKGGIVMAII
jgi:hypothetical protein